MYNDGLDMARMSNSTVYGLQKQIATTGDLHDPEMLPYSSPPVTSSKSEPMTYFRMC